MNDDRQRRAVKLWLDSLIPDRLPDGLSERVQRVPQTSRPNRLRLLPGFVGAAVVLAAILGLVALRAQLVASPATAGASSDAMPSAATRTPMASVTPFPRLAFTQAQAKAAALDTVTRFERAIYVVHDPTLAWAELSPYSQRTVSESDWASAMRALAGQSGPGYEIGPLTLDWTVLNSAYVGQEEADIRATSDPSFAYAVWVRHPGNPAISAGSEGLIVAPMADGSGWRIWLVH